MGATWDSELDRAGGDAPEIDAGSGVRRSPLGALLVEAGVASEAEISDALDEANRSGEKLGEVVLRRGWVSEERLAGLLADQWGLVAPDPATLVLDPVALARMDAGLAGELGGLPVCFDERGVVVVAVAEPKGDRFEAFRSRLGDVSFVVVPRSTLEGLLEARTAPAPESAPTPVELVGPWLAAREEPAHEDEDLAHVDSVDEVEPFAEDSPIDPASREGSAAERLRVLAADVEALEQDLVDARRRVDEQDAQVVSLRHARDADLEMITGLRAECDEHRRRFEALRAKVAELSLALGD